jgi:3-deoxy-manno-octulosonate cytidylyltransferase (CMP-KDO synthetase)
MGTVSKPRILGVVPARYASTRFPGKIIANLAGKPLVLHAYERAKKAALLNDVLIAADDERVRSAIVPFGARVVMTDPNHPTGTDRIAEAIAHDPADIIVNIQGDEALIDPETIDAAVRPMLEQPDLVMSTARRRITDMALVANPNIVKVVCDLRGRAIYFSRSPIPHIRDEADRAAGAACYWQHIGLYVYRRDFLLSFATLPQTPLEKLEKLEQLRAVEHGFPIAVIDTEYDGRGVDVPEDLEWARRQLER